MDEETQKIIAEQMKILPADVKGAIISVDYQARLQEITKRQRLLIDQAGKLEMETTLVMIGLEPLTDYIANIERELGLNSTRAKEVAMDVSENIFKPIRASLQKMNDEALAEGEDSPITEKVPETETGLNRDQILDEIENPTPNRQPDKGEIPYPVQKKEESREIEIRPKLEIEGGSAQNTASAWETKLTAPVISSRQVVEVSPESKLPEIKKRPTSGSDPYREPIM